MRNPREPTPPPCMMNSPSKFRDAFQIGTLLDTTLHESKSGPRSQAPSHGCLAHGYQELETTNKLETWDQFERNAGRTILNPWSGMQGDLQEALEFRGIDGQG